MTEPNFPIGLVVNDDTRRALERAAGAAGLSPAGYVEELIARDMARVAAVNFLPGPRTAEEKHRAIVAQDFS